MGLIFTAVILSLLTFFIACCIIYHSVFVLAFSPGSDTYFYFFLAAIGAGLLTTYLLFQSGSFLPDLRYCLPLGGLTGLLYSFANLKSKNRVSLKQRTFSVHIAGKVVDAPVIYILYTAAGILTALLLYFFIDYLLIRSVY
ncbi:MAG: hypothetical protein QM791_11105 [Ferruginibacter sp.]